MNFSGIFFTNKGEFFNRGLQVLPETIVNLKTRYFMKIDAQTLTRIIEQIKISVSRKLSSICQEEIKFERVCKDFENDLVGIVSFIGDVSFILLIMLTDSQVRKISTKFVGVEMDSQSDEIGDLISEVANIVFGDIDMDLKSINLKTERSLPTILKGK
ncbi:MAG: hypothetical protein COV67_15575, partial [Nitrospinae bacterium CG11_big_fil_rev_8_21_14_0_20_56_8]